MRPAAGATISRVGKLEFGLVDVRLGNLFLRLGRAGRGLRRLQGGLGCLQGGQRAVGSRLRRIELLAGNGLVEALRELLCALQILLCLGGSALARE